MVNFTVEIYGCLGGAFNNVGIMSPITGIVELDEKEYDRVIIITLIPFCTMNAQETTKIKITVGSTSFVTSTFDH